MTAFILQFVSVGILLYLSPSAGVFIRDTAVVLLYFASFCNPLLLASCSCSYLFTH